MIIPSKGSGTLYPTSPLAQQRTSVRSNQTAPSRSDMQFDQVQISRERSGSDRFHRELVSRLVQEVRTMHSSNDIARIKSEVQSGNYQADPTEIAAKLLLEDVNLGT